MRNQDIVFMMMNETSEHIIAVATTKELAKSLLADGLFHDIKNGFVPKDEDWKPLIFSGKILDYSPVLCLSFKEFEKGILDKHDFSSDDLIQSGYDPIPCYCGCDRIEGYEDWIYLPSLCYLPKGKASEFQMKYKVHDFKEKENDYVFYRRKVFMARMIS